MAFSFHIAVHLFLIFALVDLTLLSVRALLSRQRHGLTTLFALMGVQEAMIVFELLTTLGPLLSTYLVTAGMWSHIASLYAVFFPLWLLHGFLTAFTMVFKDVLIPRWTTAAQQEINAGVFAHSVRAWHAAGYGAVMVLDVVCCCVYYLAAIYVLGYFSDKTLYVPYHRRRWRHEQLERAALAAAVLSDTAAKARHNKADVTSAASSQRQQQQPALKRGRDERHEQHSKRKRGRGNQNNDEVNEGGASKSAFPVNSLARSPSFAQWQHCTSGRAAAASPDTDLLPCADDTITGSDCPTGGGLEDKRGGNRGQPSRLPSFPTESSTSNVHVNGEGGEDGDSTVIFSRLSPDVATTTAAAAAGGDPAFFAPVVTIGSDKNMMHDADGKRKVKRTTVCYPRGAEALHHKAVSSPSLPPPRPKRPAAFLADLPPLHLSRPFTLNAGDEEGVMNQFAAALVEHGFSTKKPERGKNTAPPSAAPSRASTKAARPTANSVHRIDSGKQKVDTSTNPDAVMEDKAEYSAESAASLCDELVNTISLTTAPRSSDSTSSPAADAVRAAGHGSTGLRRSASEPPLRTAGGTATSVNGGRSSFHRMLSARSGFNDGHAHSSPNAAGTTATDDDSLQLQPVSSSFFAHQSRSRRDSSDAQAPPPLSNPRQRKRSSSLAQFSLNGSGSGDARDGRSTPPLPPRPRPSFRIDQMTGNVVVASSDPL